MRRYVQLCKNCRHNFHGVCAVAKNTFSERPCAKHETTGRKQAGKRRPPPGTPATA